MIAPVSRRRALTGAAAGLSLTVLTACSEDGDTAVDPAGSGSSAAPEEPTATSSAPASSAAEALTPTADVPVGGGVVLADEEVVVTQPTEGEFKAFTSICTHTGCPVADVTTTINCPCHGSTFDIATGEVTGGPAPSPLAEIAIAVAGGEVVRA